MVGLLLLAQTDSGRAAAIRGYIGGVHGELAQMICLIGHGSAWLAGEPVGVEGLEERNTTFRYGRTVSFSFAAPRGEPVAASTVAAWLSQLAERDIERLWLATDLPGRRSWGLLATGGPRQERWQRTSTEIVDPDAPDSRRSRLDYTGVLTRKIAIATPPIAAAQEELLAALAEARAFAAEYELTFWAGWFAAAEALATVGRRSRGFTGHAARARILARRQTPVGDRDRRMGVRRHGILGRSTDSRGRRRTLRSRVGPALQSDVARVRRERQLVTQPES